MKRISTAGYILMEALVSIAVLGVLVVNLLPSINFLLQRSRGSAVNTDANLLLQEGIEISYNVLSNGWTAYPDGLYQVAIDQTSGRKVWTLIPNVEEQIGGKFTRTIEIFPVSRNNSTGEIGVGNPDPDSRRVVSTVTWVQGAETRSISANLLLLQTN